MVGDETRQVVEIELYWHVTGYRAEVIESEDGAQVVADFPKEITLRVQCNNSLKAHTTFLSQRQLFGLRSEALSRGLSVKGH